MIVSGFRMLQFVETSFCGTRPIFVHQDFCPRSCDEGSVEDIGGLLGSSSFCHIVEMKKQFGGRVMKVWVNQNWPLQMD
jgi:hypothetical protein